MIKNQETSRNKHQEANIVNHKINSQNFWEFNHKNLHFQTTLNNLVLSSINDNFQLPSNSTKKDNRTTLTKKQKHPTTKQSATN